MVRRLERSQTVALLRTHASTDTAMGLSGAPRPFGSSCWLVFIPAECRVLREAVDGAQAVVVLVGWAWAYGVSFASAEEAMILQAGMVPSSGSWLTSQRAYMREGRVEWREGSVQWKEQPHAHSFNGAPGELRSGNTNPSPECKAVSLRSTPSLCENLSRLLSRQRDLSNFLELSM